MNTIEISLRELQKARLSLNYGYPYRIVWKGKAYIWEDYGYSPKSSLYVEETPAKSS